MSEGAPAPIAAPARRLSAARARGNRLNALEALERGFALFQSTFSTEAWRYYFGALPLVLCFIPLWVFDGQIRVSNSALLLEAGLLAGAYVLRAWLVEIYMQRIRERAFGVPRPKTGGTAAQTASIGRLLAWKITLSAAAVATLPTFAGAAWFYGACEFASLEAPEDTERHSLGDCFALSSQWFGGGLLLFLMLFPLWIAVWLNGFILAIAVPQLLHSIFGISTLLSTATGFQTLLQSSALWLSLFAAAWLALDPIVKCTFVVVYQQLRSRREGDDLRGLLAGLPRNQQKKAEVIASIGRGVRVGASIVLAAISLGAPLSTARAAQAPVVTTAEDSAQAAHVLKLRQALNAESQREIYRWHDVEQPSSPTWFDKLLAELGRVLDRAWNAFLDVLRRLWPRGLTLSPGNGKGGAWQRKDLWEWRAVSGAVTLAAGAVLFWLRRRGEPTQRSTPIATAPLLDLSDAAVASERSEDEWFTLANRLQGEGDLRLAVRAAYLGLLAGLAQREWLTIRRDRTNREYLEECTRRWRRRPQAAVEVRAEIPETLRGSLRLFDRVWYGSHALTSAAVAAYCQDQRELLSHV
jgi:hypothetical protein